jgi:hypothetical protein
METTKLPVVKIKWDEDQHPRAPAGESTGGQFTDGGDGGGAAASSGSANDGKPPAPPSSHTSAITHSSKVAKVKVALKSSSKTQFAETHKFTVAGTPGNFDIFRRSLAKAGMGMTVMGDSDKQFSWVQQREAGKGGTLNFIFTRSSPAVKA